MEAMGERGEHESITYLSRTEDILKALIQSRDFGYVIGIFALSLGPVMIMTAVESIIEIKNDRLIVLRETDLLGFKLPEEQILLSEIVNVHLFRTRFDDPFHVKLRGIGENAGS